MPSGHAQKFHPAGHPLRSSTGIGAVPLVLILILGLALRLYAWQHAGIINSDGAIYIHQARALYFGLWDFINHSGQNYGTLPYPTITTLSIAALYTLCGDWVTSGTLVSLLFGTATIVPLYGLIRTFFRRDIASLATVVYAVTPILIDGSVDIVRDPACWFFLVLGLYFFGRQERRPVLYLLLSNISLILAAWSRVECVIFIVISAGYLFWDREAKPVRRAALFLLPTMAAFLAFIGSQVVLHPGDVNWYRVADIPAKLQTSIAKYHDVHMKLTELIAHPQAGIPVDFFDNVRDILWFVGFGVLLQNTLETFFYPYCLLYLAGLKKLREKIREERRVLYFSLLTLVSFGVLYVYVFLNWEMENRWVAMALFPSFMFLGFGLERTVSYLQSRHGLKRGMALALVCLVILGFALAKNTRPRGEDKIVFRQLGETIARLEGNAAKIEVLTVGSSARWISFYANAGFRGAPYPDEHRLYEPLIGASYETFLDNLKKSKIRYLVWEEKNWPAGHFDFLKSPWERDFIRLGVWSHPDTGKIILFRLR
jgi:4-amino-4-deoxy-L-arabinose transferase-like glycosyltransferase